MASSSTSKIDLNAGKTKLLREKSIQRTCKYCLAKFASSNTYFSIHQRTTHYTTDGRLVYFCSKCPRKSRVYYSKEKEFLAHFKSKHDQDGDQSDDSVTDYQLRSSESFNRSTSLSIGAQVTCRYCLASFASSDHIARHQRSVHHSDEGDMVYLCSKCPKMKSRKYRKQFSTEKAFLTHLAKKHGEKKNGTKSNKEKKSLIGESEKMVKTEETEESGGEFSKESESNLSAWTTVKVEPEESEAIDDTLTGTKISKVKMEPPDE